MTDGQVVSLARRIDEHLHWVRLLIDAIQKGGHANAEAITAELDRNGLTAFAWATHVVHTNLLHPERWETGDYGIRRKRS